MESDGLLKTDHWRLAPREDARLPGYLILAAKDSAARSLADLPAAALAELGSLLARAERALHAGFGECRVHVCRWGHAPGHPPHFHVIAVHEGIEAAYAADPRGTDPEPDGPAYDLWLTRVFVEDPDPPAVRGPDAAETVRRLRAALAADSEPDA